MGWGLCWWTVRPRGSLQPSKYFGPCLNIWIWISLSRKLSFINSFQNEGLSPSCIALSFDDFCSIPRRSVWLFFLSLYSCNISYFQTFLSEDHLRDLICRNAHLVHQNLYCMNFTVYVWYSYHKFWISVRFLLYVSVYIESLVFTYVWVCLHCMFGINLRSYCKFGTHLCAFMLYVSLFGIHLFLICTCLPFYYMRLLLTWLSFLTCGCYSHVCLFITCDCYSHVCRF
jgi:hypothetical protein